MPLIAAIDATALLIALVVAVVVVLAFATMKEFGQVGRGGIEPPGPGEMLGAQGPPAADEQEEEVRQFVEAANVRRERRGEAQLDVDAEVERLLTERADELTPDDEAQLREEIREQVLATNMKRAQRGERPLDVEAEIERWLKELR